MSAFESHQGPLERTFIFVGLALENGWIEIHHITHAFTVWICDKTQSVGKILVQIQAITEQQRLELDRMVDQQLSCDRTAMQALSAMDCLEDLTNHLDFLPDDDLSQLLDKFAKEKRLNLDGLWRDSEKSNQEKESSGKESFHSHGNKSADRFEWKESLPEKSGMGELSIAIDKELNRLVVVKKIKPRNATDPLYRGLFQLEGEVTGHLEHPNIPPVYSLNKDSRGRDFFAMRYFKGKKLTEAIREYHALPRSEGGKRKEKLTELLQSFQTACLAVEFAHHRGVLHCDLKPDNIMVGPYGETLVIDWGLVFVAIALKNSATTIDQASFIEDQSGRFSPSKAAETGLHQSQGGLRNSVGGTLPYMAPEQLRATGSQDIEQITSATDVFLLGATLYHLLTNRPPYIPKTKNQETVLDFYARVTQADCPSPRKINPGIAKPLESIVKKAMRSDPMERYQSSRELADDVKRWLSDEPTKAHLEGLSGKAARWLRKNRKTAGFTTAALVASIIIGGLFVIREQQNTIDFASNLQIIANSGFRMIEDLEPFIVNKETLTPERKALLVEASAAYENIISKYRKTDAAKKMAARIFRVTANIHRFDLEIEQADPLYSRAIGIYKSMQGGADGGAEISVSLAHVLIDYGQLLVNVGRVKEARRSYFEAREQMDKNFSPDSQNTVVLRTRGLILLSMAGLSSYLDDFPACEEECREALAVFDGLKDNGNMRGYDFICIASCLTYLGASLREQKKLPQSEEILLRARDTLLPFINDLRAYDYNTVRGVAKLDVLRTYIEAKIEQNITLMMLNKDVGAVEGSLKSIVEQAEFINRAFGKVPRFRLLLARALAARGGMYMRLNKKDLYEDDFKKSKTIIVGVIDENDDARVLGEAHLEFLSKMSLK